MNPKDTQQSSSLGSASSIGSADSAEPLKPVHQLIYVSVARSELPQEELVSILETSRTHNAAHQITGLLLYSNCNIVQILEGSENDVRDLFARIQADKRHDDVKMLSFQRVPKRDFKNWSMGFKRVDSLSFQQKMPEFNDIIEQRTVNLKTLAGFSIKVGFVLKNYSLMNRLDAIKRPD